MKALGVLWGICVATGVWAAVAFEQMPTGVVIRQGDIRRTLEFYGPQTVRVKTDLGRDHWQPLGGVQDASILSTDHAGGFVAATIGPFVVTK